VALTQLIFPASVRRIIKWDKLPESEDLHCNWPFYEQEIQPTLEEVFRNLTSPKMKGIKC